MIQPHLRIRTLWLSFFLAAGLVALGCSKGCDCEGTPPAPKPVVKTPTPPPPTAVTPPPAPPAKPVDFAQLPETVMEVNGEKISRESVAELIKRRNVDLAAQPAENQMRIVQNMAAELATDKAYEQEMKKLNAEIDPAALKSKMDQTLSIFGSTPEEIEKNLSWDPMIRNTLSDHVRRNHMLERIYEEKILRNITVTENEMRDYYNQNIARFTFPSHMLVYLIAFKYANDQEKTAKKTLAEQTLARVRGGEDFATVASQVSEDDGSRRMGGFNEKAQVREDYKPTGEVYYDWLYASKSGQISDVLDYTQAAPPMLLIMKNDGVVESKVQPFDLVRDQIELILRSQKAETSIEDFSQQLQDSTQIKNNIE